MRHICREHIIYHEDGREYKVMSEQEAADLYTSLVKKENGWHCVTHSYYEA
jgi:hypothetical protein